MSPFTARLILAGATALAALGCGSAHAAGVDAAIEGKGAALAREAGTGPSMILAADLRETNLRRSPTGMLVLGAEGGRTAHKHK
jgi:hypothetical protein